MNLIGQPHRGHGRTFSPFRSFSCLCPAAAFGGHFVIRPAAIASSIKSICAAISPHLGNRPARPLDRGGSLVMRPTCTEPYLSSLVAHVIGTVCSRYLRKGRRPRSINYGFPVSWGPGIRSSFNTVQGSLSVCALFRGSVSRRGLLPLLVRERPTVGDTSNALC